MEKKWKSVPKALRRELDILGLVDNWKTRKFTFEGYNQHVCEEFQRLLSPRLLKTYLKYLSELLFDSISQASSSHELSFLQLAYDGKDDLPECTIEIIEGSEYSLTQDPGPLTFENDLLCIRLAEKLTMRQLWSVFLYSLIVNSMLNGQELLDGLDVFVPKNSKTPQMIIQLAV